eukprot:2898954-Rhodomonas_salina.1
MPSARALSGSSLYSTKMSTAIEKTSAHHSSTFSSERIALVSVCSTPAKTPTPTAMNEPKACMAGYVDASSLPKNALNRIVSIINENRSTKNSRKKIPKLTPPHKGRSMDEEISMTEHGLRAAGEARHLNSRGGPRTSFLPNKE